MVENAVKITYRRIFAPLRDRLFHSLEELNETIRDFLEKHNNTLFQRIKMSRRELFDETEKTTLRPLPLKRYELKEFRRFKVPSNYHIEIREDNHYYSVPFKYKGKNVTSSPPARGGTSSGNFGEIGDIAQFRSADALICYCGLIPSSHSSGTCSSKRNCMAKRGQSSKVFVLYQITLRSLECNPPLREYYENKLAQSKPKLPWLIINIPKADCIQAHLLLLLYNRECCHQHQL